MKRNIKLSLKDLPLSKQKKMLNMQMLWKEHKKD
jgi:hypothetical protein